MKRATGIGGIFFKCNKPGIVKEWYSKNPGVNMNEYGASFEWIQAEAGRKRFTQ